MSQTRSSYEPTRLAAGQAATSAPTGPCDQPWAMFAVTHRGRKLSTANAVVTYRGRRIAIATGTTALTPPE